METKVLNLKGEEVGKLTLPEKAFGVRPSREFLHEIATIYLANRRSATAQAKTRAEVSGGGAKPWKQKGTGRARHGSNRSPIWRKGGVCFGPRAHSMRLHLPRRKSLRALAQALSVRAQDGGLRVLENLALDGAKTRQVAEMLSALKAHKRSLLVIEQKDANLARASRNIQGLRISLVSHLNAYDVLAARNLIFTRGALEKLAPKWN